MGDEERVVNQARGEHGTEGDRRLAMEGRSFVSWMGEAARQVCTAWHDAEPTRSVACDALMVGFLVYCAAIASIPSLSKVTSPLTPFYAE